MLDALKSNKLLLIISGTLIAIVLIGFVAFYFLQSPEEPVASAPPVIAQTETPVIEEPIQEVTTQNESEQTDNYAPLVDESLLDQPIAEDSALLKDELVQLNDIQVQLNEQKAMIEQQHADADKLLELKEQQLAALEKQLATETP